MRKGASAPFCIWTPARHSFSLPHQTSSYLAVSAHILPDPLPAGLPVVLDTNTVLALWMFEDPRLPLLRGAVESGHLRPFTRQDCLDELQRVLAYAQFGQPPERQAALAATYATCCARIEPVAEPEVVLPACLDRDDQKFLETARDAPARLLVTRDKLLLKLARRPVIAARFAILTPERIEALLARQGMAPSPAPQSLT